MSSAAKLSRRVTRKKAIVALVILLGAGGIWWLIGRGGKGGGDEVTYKPVTIETGNVEETVTAQGKLEPKEYVDVGAQVSGQLQKIHVEIGDVVKQGDLLAEIDPRVYESRVQGDKAKLKTLEAQLAEQQAQIVFNRQQHARNLRLIKTDAISKEALEDSSAALKMAEARANSLRAQIEEVQSALKGNETNLSYTKIYAPMDGSVVTLPAKEGQTLNANQTAPILLQLANLDVMTVIAQVAEADVMRLTPGMPVYFTTLGQLDRKWQGEVRQIEPTPEVINDVVLYRVSIDADNKDRKLMNGMSTQVFFVLGAANEVPIIPLEALGRRVADKDSDQGKAYMVKTGSPDNPKESIILVGLQDRARAEVRSGLAAGDSVLVPMRRPQKGQGGQGGAGGGQGRGGRNMGPRL